MKEHAININWRSVLHNSENSSFKVWQFAHLAETCKCKICYWKEENKKTFLRTCNQKWGAANKLEGAVTKKKAPEHCSTFLNGGLMGKTSDNVKAVSKTWMQKLQEPSQLDVFGGSCQKITEMKNRFQSATTKHKARNIFHFF